MNDLYIEDAGDGTLGELRAVSAYSFLRLLIGLLFWLGLVVGLGAFVFYAHSLGPFLRMAPGMLAVWIGILVFQLLFWLVVRGLALALLDIADAQLQQVERSRRTFSKTAESFPQ